MKKLIIKLVLMAGVGLLLGACNSAKLYEHSKTKKDYKNPDGDVLKVKVTGYCHCAECTNWTRNKEGQTVVKSGDNKGKFKTVGKTTSKTKMRKKLTLAANIKTFPYGTRIKIPGWGLGVVEDQRILPPNHIEIYFSSHSEAVKWGEKEMDVTVYYMIEKLNK